LAVSIYAPREGAPFFRIPRVTSFSYQRESEVPGSTQRRRRGASLGTLGAASDMRPAFPECPRVDDLNFPTKKRPEKPGAHAFKKTPPSGPP
ncbi:MAG: hypothetical protein JG760_939, partial [Desulfomicrobiaceae bacterium]|nr:hypothetical protein [Desulfomicrobiaceae bacterium]